jgi:hypothetical protein
LERNTLSTRREGNVKPDRIALCAIVFTSGLWAATPSISLVAQPSSATVGNTIAVKATLSGGSSPTGTVTFNLYNNPSGTGTPLFTDTEALSGNTATSAGYTTTAVGTFYWLGHYNGDNNNSAITSDARAVTITAATPAINTTQQPASATIGSTIADLATVSGGFSPTGTVTFNLYNNPNGTGTPLFTDTEPLTGATATSKGYVAAATGTDYWVATYSGDTNNSGVTSGTALEPVTITPGTPAISTTQQPASTTIGNAIADKATLSGGFGPTGTVTFNLYNNPNGTGTPLFTDTEPLTGGTATSKSFTVTATGTLYWVATYNGDSNNSAIVSGTSLEPVTITSGTPAISTTQQPATAIVGTPIADSATVTGGSSPTGTVTFNLYNNPNGTGTPLFTDTETLSSGTAASKTYATTATGTLYWVATYNGDNNNAAVTSGTSLEPVTINAARPSINTTQQPATATVGSPIADLANVTGGFNPTGTVTFNLYNNPNGTGTPLFTDTETLSGGTATSKGYTTTATGTVYWVATYNGDSNNATVASGTSLEPVVVSAATLAISTTQQPATTTVGSAIADKATVTGGNSPTGTVTFNLYNNPNGTGTPLFADTETLSGGTATSKSYTTTATGTLYWVATYNGDNNNSPVTSGTALEPVTVGAATLAINTVQQPAAANTGSAIADMATVTGGFNPTGTVTFRLYNNPNGTGTPLFTDTEPLSGGTATSASYTTTAPGTLYWVATYNGDNNNSAISSGTASEPVVITSTPPPTESPFLVKPFANLDKGESFIDLVNTGGNGASLLGPGLGPATGNICANVYAFDPGEELISCCSCLITPDQVVSLGVNRDLTSKTLTGNIPTSVTVKLLNTLAGPGGTAISCTNTATGAGGNALAGGLAAWGTTLHATPTAGSYSATETPFRASTLSGGELATLYGRCAFIVGNASGFGICSSCRAGSLGAQKQ